MTGVGTGIRTGVGTGIGTGIALRLADVHKSFGATKVIQGVSLDIPKGQRHAIIGPNGAGKTTLFNLMTGRFEVSSGRVELIRRVTEGKTLVMVEHDMSVVFGLADIVTVLVYGEIVASDRPAAIRANPAVQEAYLGTAAH